MSAILSMLHDERPIFSVSFHGADGGTFTVGRANVERIAAYAENGQMAPVPWIAVYKNGEIWLRIPAEQVQVEYA